MFSFFVMEVCLNHLLYGVIFFLFFEKEKKAKNKKIFEKVPFHFLEKGLFGGAWVSSHNTIL